MREARFPSGTILTILALGFAAGCAPDTGRPDAVPEEVIRHNILGAAQMGQTQWAEAEAEFRKALDARPDDPLLLTNAALAVNQQERPDEALDLLQRAVAADAGYAPAHFALGLLQNRQGDFEKAAEHFARVAEIESDDLFTRYFLGTSLARIDRPTEAVEALRAALERDPTHVSTLYALGRLLLQQGEQEEGLQLINRSQEIRTRSGLDEAVGSEYGEQGRLSRAADYPGAALEAPPAVPVTFESAARVDLERGPGGLAWTTLDDGDGTRLLVAQRASVLQLLPPGRSEPLVIAPEDEAAIVALAAGDVDDDAALDLALLLLLPDDDAGATLVPACYHRDGDGYRTAAAGERFGGTAAVSLGGGIGGVDLAFVDRDHDGDLDLFWCWSAVGGGGCKIATNDGSGAFDVRDGSEHGVEFETGDDDAVTVAFSDVDNDRDIDLLAAHRGGVRAYSNERDGTFREITASVGLADMGGELHGLAIGDLDKDGWMDLVLAQAAGVRVALNRRGSFTPPEPLGPAVDAGSGDRVLVFDVDNDGFLDVAGGGASGPVLVRNLGAGRWESWSGVLAEESPAAPLADLDVDGDGDLDLAIVDASGGVSLWINEGGNANRWIVLDSRGVGDNEFGIGAKVEVLAGALRQKFEITRPRPLHVGLGARDTVQATRYLWPSGVLQDEIGLEAGSAVRVAQLDRKGTSCPLLYGWRDGGWRFVTDFLGGAAVGYQLAPGVFSVPDADEYVRVEGGLSETAEGTLRLRLNNQLEEVLWFDQVELVVVDHPDGTELYPNERLMPGPPFPGFELYASADVRPVAGARSAEDGRDLTDLLADADRRYVDDFELLRPKGYAQMHTLELDLGAFSASDRVVLLLDGWIDYADSSANVAAHQAGLELVPPRLHVADGSGGWLDVSERMGFPAGLPKTMSVDLTRLFRSADHRLRIATNMRIYWDRARVMVGGANTPLDVTRVAAVRAELRFGGFPRPTSLDGRTPHAYDPLDVAATHSWKAHEGTYTGLGDVGELLAESDDRFVTTRNGDEIVLDFPAPPPVPRGRVRTFLLYADGFGKDMDPNSAASDEIGPVPFHGMPRYPYGPEIVPPVAQDPNGLVPRRVMPSESGWPGALPLGRHAG